MPHSRVNLALPPSHACLAFKQLSQTKSFCSIVYRMFIMFSGESRARLSAIGSLSSQVHQKLAERCPCSPKPPF